MFPVGGLTAKDDNTDVVP